MKYHVTDDLYWCSISELWTRNQIEIFQELDEVGVIEVIADEDLRTQNYPITTQNVCQCKRQEIAVILICMQSAYYSSSGLD